MKFLTAKCLYHDDSSIYAIYTLSLHDALPIFFFCVSKNVSVSCAYTQGKREQFSGFNRTLDAINNVYLACTRDRKSGSAGMPRPISYAVFCLKKKNLTAFSHIARHKVIDELIR